MVDDIKDLVSQSLNRIDNERAVLIRMYDHFQLDKQPVNPFRTVYDVDRCKELVDSLPMVIRTHFDNGEHISTEEIKDLLIERTKKEFDLFEVARALEVYSWMTANVSLTKNGRWHIFWIGV